MAAWMASPSMTAEYLGRPRSWGSSSPREGGDAQPLELDAPVPPVEHRDPPPQRLVTQHMRQQLEEHLEIVGQGVQAAHLLDESLGTLLGIDVLHAVLGSDVLVVDHGVEYRRDEPGLVAEVVGDHRLVLARARGHGVERECGEAFGRHDLLGRKEQALRCLRQGERGSSKASRTWPRLESGVAALSATRREPVSDALDIAFPPVSNGR